MLNIEEEVKTLEEPGSDITGAAGAVPEGSSEGGSPAEPLESVSSITTISELSSTGSTVDVAVAVEVVSVVVVPAEVEDVEPDELDVGELAVELVEDLGLSSPPPPPPQAGYQRAMDASTMTRKKQFSSIVRFGERLIIFTTGPSLHLHICSW